MKKKVIFHFETITGLLLHGADTKITELRVPSIKGALRFWWRAMNSHLVEKDKNQKCNYAKLLKHETEIFGGINPAMRSKVILRIINQNIIKSECKYNKTQSECIQGSWDLLCEYEESIEKELQIAFSMLNLFGTLGSKARNGFGSVQISSKDFHLLNELDIKNYLKSKNAQLVPYTAFNEINVKETGIENSADEALETLKSIIKKYSNQRIPNSQAQRRPKRYWFSVKRTDDGKYKWQGLYLPEKTSQKNKE